MFFEQLLKMIQILKNLIAADRDGNWSGHLQAVQDRLPILSQTGSISYTRYGSIYLEMMRQLPQTHPQLYKEFSEGKFVVKTLNGNFNAVSPDMKLEQTIQRSKKSPGGVIGQTKQQGFVTEWELCYHEVLAISNTYRKITKSTLAESDSVIFE